MAFTRVVQLAPNSADDFNNLACILKDQGILHEAIHYYQASLKLKADPNVFCNLVHSLQMTCDWSDYPERMQKLVELISFQLQQGQFPSVHPHHGFLYPLSNQTRKQIAAAHANYASQNIANASQKRNYTFDHLRTRAPGERLRVGFVSSDYKVGWGHRGPGLPMAGAHSLSLLSTGPPHSSFDAKHSWISRSLAV
jgi:protein O-GlcNAc transferase